MQECAGRFLHSEISRYVITVTPVDGGTDSLTFYHNDTRRDFNVTGLAPGTRYEFHVIAISESEGIVGKSPQRNSGFANTTFTGTFLSILLYFYQTFELHKYVDICKLSDALN